MGRRPPLAIPLVLAALLLLAALYGPTLVADSVPRGAERVTVTLQKPEAFKDFKATSVTDIDMAGEFETWRGPQACSVRVMLDLYTPRVVLDFRLTDRDGKVVSAGHRDLSDPLYLTRAVTLSTDPLRYEKNLLLDWLQKELGERLPAGRGATLCAPTGDRGGVLG